MKTSLEIESKFYDKKLIATFEIQSKGLKKIDNCSEDSIQFGQKVSNEKNYENNSNAQTKEKKNK